MSKGMKVLRALAGMAALGLGSGAGADTIVVQDSTFLNNLWMLTTYGGPGSSDGQQAATTGNPAPSRGWSVAVTSTSGTVTAFHKMLTPLATIPPTGEVTSIAASFDVLLGGASGPIQMGLAIEQGGVLYLGPTVMNFPPLGQFGPVSFSNLVATDFHRWEATESPNFSASRQPFTLGVYARVSGMSGFPQVFAGGQFDNLVVTVQTSASTPALLHEYNFENNAKDAVAAADGSVGSGASFQSGYSGTSVPFVLGRALAVGTAIAGPTVQAPMQQFAGFGANNFSIAFWYRSGGSTGAKHYIVDAANGNGWRLSRLGNSQLRFERVLNGAATGFNTPGGGSFNSGWHHFAFVSDRRGSGLNRWYFDGQAVVNTLDSSMDLVNPDQDILIGAATEAAANEGMDGSLDKLQIFNFALTAAQVGLLAGLPACPTDLDHNGTIGIGDIGAVLQSGWGTSCP